MANVAHRFAAPRAHSRAWLAAAVLMLSPALRAATPDDTADVRQVYSGEMRPDTQVRWFMHSDRWFPSAPVGKGSTVRALPRAPMPLTNVHFDSKGRRYDLFDYLALNRVAGLLVLKDGKVALEDYELGASAQTHWPSFSIAKSVTSTLVGAALQDGAIKSLDDPITRYVPALLGSAYDDVTIRQALRMASGVDWNETYTDPASDRRKVLELQIQRKAGTLLQYMHGLKRAAPPGTRWHYDTGETNVVGAVIEGATHRRLADYLREKIWAPWGMESDAHWWTESAGGMGIGGSGLSATLRDFARFGWLVQQDGVIEGRRLVPAGWFDEAGSGADIDGKFTDYGYFWWTFPREQAIHAGAFTGIGIFGQYLYVNRRERVVIAVLSARPKPSSAEEVIEDGDFFAAVVQALR